MQEVQGSVLDKRADNEGEALFFARQNITEQAGGYFVQVQPVERVVQLCLPNTQVC